jgi:hypothetical protein
MFTEGEKKKEDQRKKRLFSRLSQPHHTLVFFFYYVWLGVESGERSGLESRAKIIKGAREFKRLETSWNNRLSSPLNECCGCPGL